jgi:hypothetical protein
MARTPLVPVVTSVFAYEVVTMKPGPDGTTHSAEYAVQYGTRKFKVQVQRKLRPAPKGKRRTESFLEVMVYRRGNAASRYQRVQVPAPPAVPAAALDRFVAALEGAPKASPNAKRVTMRQVGGDDGYCWAVMVDGVPKWEGMQRGEASSRRNAEIARLDAGSKGPADVLNREGLARLERNLRESRLDVAASDTTIAAARKRAERSLDAAR